MKIGVNDGHTLRGAGTGAVGIIKEGEHTRLVGEEVRVKSSFFFNTKNKRKV